MPIPISEPPVIVPFTFGTEVSNEGDFVQVTCNVKRGDEPLTVSWSLKGDVISSEPSITTSMIGTRTSILMITSVGYRHSGQYTCTAKNAAGIDHFTTELKVNGKQRCHSKERGKEKERCQCYAHPFSLSLILYKNKPEWLSVASFFYIV